MTAPVMMDNNALQDLVTSLSSQVTVRHSQISTGGQPSKSELSLLHTKASTLQVPDFCRWKG